MGTTERLRALNDVLRHARRSPFHRERLPTLPLRSWDELRRLPLTTRQDLCAQSPRGMVCAPARELLQYHETSGTTGAPASVWYGRDDLTEVHTRLAEWGVGFGPGDRVLVRFPYALSTIGHFVHAAAQACGACVIPADSRSTITPLLRVLDLMQRLEVTVLATISLSAVILADAAESAGLSPRRDFPRLRAIACAGEPVGEPRRELLRELWGVPVFDNYGMTESGPLAMDCAEQRLHPWDDLFWMEILDDDLAAEVPPGQTGHLVVTSLTPRATPLVRYVTGDRVTRRAVRCACGERTTLEVHGRARESLSVAGRTFDVAALSAIAAKLPSRRFWRAEPLPDGLRFVVEEDPGSRPVPPSLVAELTREHGVAVEVHVVPRGTLYDRGEPLSYGMKGKPVYIAPAREGL